MLYLRGLKISTEGYFSQCYRRRLCSKGKDLNLQTNFSFFSQEEIEIIFMVIFTLECAMKILAYGFTMHQGAYLRSVWNFIDFFIVLIGYVLVLAIPVVTQAYLFQNTYGINSELVVLFVTV